MAFEVLYSLLYLYIYVYQHRGLIHIMIVHTYIYTYVPIQVFISSTLPSMAFFTKCGSAKNGLAMLIMSAAPLASTLSATAGMLIRLVVHRGMPISPFSFLVTQVNALKFNQNDKDKSRRLEPIPCPCMAWYVGGYYTSPRCIRMRSYDIV